MENTSFATKVERLVLLRTSGRLCAAEVWNVLCDIISHNDVAECLDRLPNQIQQDLVGVFRKSPQSLIHSAGDDKNRQDMVTWCEDLIENSRNQRE